MLNNDRGGGYWGKFLLIFISVIKLVNISLCKYFWLFNV